MQAARTGGVCETRGQGISRNRAALQVLGIQEPGRASREGDSEDSAIWQWQGDKPGLKSVKESQAAIHE